MSYDHLPISPENLIMTLCGNMYFEAMKLVEECPPAEVKLSESREAMAVLAALLQSTVSRLVERARLVSMSSVEDTPMGYIIKGIRRRK